MTAANDLDHQPLLFRHGLVTFKRIKQVSILLFNLNLITQILANLPRHDTLKCGAGELTQP